MKWVRLIMGAAAFVLMSVVVMPSRASAQAASGPVSPAAFREPETSGLEKVSWLSRHDRKYEPSQGPYTSATLKGRVVVEWARLPWDPIPIVVTCDHVLRYRALTDAEGRFSIPGISPHQWPGMNLGNCEVSAELPGFTSTKFEVSGLVVMDNLDIGTITLRPVSHATVSVEDGQGEVASQAVTKCFNKAREEWFQGKVGKAGRDLKKVVDMDPKFADAWYALGRAEQSQNRLTAALAAYNRAILIDPALIPPCLHIAEISALKENWKTVAAITSRALTMYPTGTPQLWYYNALANYHLGGMSQAEAGARKSLAMDPQHLEPNSEPLLAVILAGRGDYTGALSHLRNSLSYVESGPNRRIILREISQLEQAVPQNP